MFYEEQCHGRLSNFCYISVQVLQTWKEKKKKALKLFSAETDQKTKPLGRKRQCEVGPSIELHLKVKGKTQMETTQKRQHKNTKTMTLSSPQGIPPGALPSSSGKSL